MGRAVGTVLNYWANGDSSQLLNYCLAIMSFGGDLRTHLVKRFPVSRNTSKLYERVEVCNLNPDNLIKTNQVWSQENNWEMQSCTSADLKK